MPVSNANKNFIGILGGSFDPPHAGHLKISLETIKKLKLKKFLWIITKKSPFKSKSYFSLKERIHKCKYITKKNKKIEVKYFEDQINSKRTINVLNYVRKSGYKKIFLVLGADSLIKFHKWTKWKEILKICVLVVFFFFCFDKKAKSSIAFNFISKKRLIYMKDSKINISSSKLRKIYLK